MKTIEQLNSFLEACDLMILSIELLKKQTTDKITRLKIEIAVKGED